MNTSLNVTAIVNEEVAAVEVNGVTQDGFYDDDRKGVGWAKKHPTDSPNPEIAYNLAMARALQDLANQYARNAADIAGFPVVVDLDAYNPETDDQASLVHLPADIVSTFEGVSV